MPYALLATLGWLTVMLPWWLLKYTALLAWWTLKIAFWILAGPIILLVYLIRRFSH